MYEVNYNNNDAMKALSEVAAKYGMKPEQFHKMKLATEGKAFSELTREEREFVKKGISAFKSNPSIFDRYN